MYISISHSLPLSYEKLFLIAALAARPRHFQPATMATHGLSRRQEPPRDAATPLGYARVADAAYIAGGSALGVVIRQYTEDGRRPAPLAHVAAQASSRRMYYFLARHLFNAAKADGFHFGQHISC